MTTPNTARISINDVATELGIANPTGLHLGDPRIRQLSFQPVTGPVRLSLCRGKSALDMLIDPFPVVITSQCNAPSDGSSSAARIVIQPDGTVGFYGLNSATLALSGTFGSFSGGVFLGLQLPNQIFKTIDAGNTGRGWWYRVNGNAGDNSGARHANLTWYPFTSYIALDTVSSVDSYGATVRGSVDFARSNGGVVVQSCQYLVSLTRV